MDVDFGKGNLLNKAKEKAKKISESYHDEQIFYLITNDFSTNNNGYNKKMLNNQIDKIVSTPKIKSINDILSKINSLDSNNHLYFISDMQTNSIKINGLHKNINNKISLIPLENKILPNLSIDSCFISSPVFISEKEVNISVIISNNGTNNIIDEVIYLYLDNKQKSQQYINLGAGEKKISFTFLIENQDIIYGELRLNDSHITYDNKLFHIK